MPNPTAASAAPGKPSGASGFQRHERVALYEVQQLARRYGSPLSARQIQQQMQQVQHLSELSELAAFSGHGSRRLLELALPDLIDLWNFTPRDELEGRCPAAVFLDGVCRGGPYEPGRDDQFGSRFIFGDYTTLLHSTPQQLNPRGSERPAPGATRGGRGFTLTELLVAISIVALLTALALPAMRGAMDRADQAVCLSNLRQLGQAFSEHLADHGHYPAAEIEVTDAAGRVTERKRWYHALGPYLNTPAASWSSGQGRPGVVLPSADDRDQSVFAEVLRCPQAQSWDVGRNGSYGYNHQVFGDARVLAPAAGGSSDASAATGPIRRRYPVRRHEIWHPARTLLLTDCAGTGTESYRPAATPSSRALGNHAFTVDPPQLPSVQHAGRTTQWGSDSAIPGVGDPLLPSRPHGRHRGGCCVLFADGHAKWVPLADLTESNALWGSDPVAGGG